jgi:hypothetical protein
MSHNTYTQLTLFLPAVKINGSVDTPYNYADPSPQDNASLPQWNESARDHAAALGMATGHPEDDYDDQDYPLAMDDMELGDFLMDAMDHANGHQPTPHELAACDALHILEGLPDPPMNLPPP